MLILWNKLLVYNNMLGEMFRAVLVPFIVMYAKKEILVINICVDEKRSRE